MPASQLKRLKTSLREQGITGPQKSKKQKNAHKNRSASERIERSAALQQIRDSFNPFELRQASRPTKFATAGTKTAANGGSGRYKEVLHRPGVSKSAGEQMRRATLLPELQRKNKVGGLVDRRIGEGDTDMTPEEKAVQRFARERQSKKGAALFNLEASDDELDGAGLTHGGRRLDDLEADDFNDPLSDGSEEEENEGFLKRKRLTELQATDEGAGEEATEDGPERKRSRKEVMEEVIAKSKLYKFERQKAKDENEDLREELDKGMGEMLALLRGHQPPPKVVQQQEAAQSSNGPVMNPDRQRLLDGLDGVKADKEYDARLRQYAQDTRAQPSERSKTDEEKAADDAKRLKDLEDKRQKRMRGEEISDDEDDEEDDRRQELTTDAIQRAVEGDEDMLNEAAVFGLGSSTAQLPAIDAGEKLVLDDEDEFALDEDLVASDSDVDLSSDGSGDESSAEEEDGEAEEFDEEDEFVSGILGNGLSKPVHPESPRPSTDGVKSGRLAYTYPCPRSHSEFLGVIETVPVSELTTVIQRIRALHHPSLSASNKEAMADFSTTLVDHIAYMAGQKQSLAVIEQVIRHLHSLSRSYPIEIAAAFRKHLATWHERGYPFSGDLVVLTAIGSIYPTSDHFHQVVTPAITLMARYLGLTVPVDTAAQTTGAFMVKLCLHYQRLSKRYIPEAVRFTYRALTSRPAASAEQQRAHLANLTSMAELWRDKTALTQILTPFIQILQQLPSAKKELQNLRILLQAARLRLRPLELHHHRPVAIRSSIPKFEEGFNPDKHYDPDRERSEASKLQKEYKRERKGALRELRKDANFIAREQLREKKERDAAYERKYRRLVAEIQGQEGHEAKEYEREKKARKRARG